MSGALVLRGDEGMEGKGEEGVRAEGGEEGEMRGRRVLY